MAKKKLLPKDIEAMLKEADIPRLKVLFDSIDVNARGGVFKQTALAFNECPDDLARWLVAHGADLAAGDSYGDTPLHSRAGHWQGRIEILLELGADVHLGENQRGTPLHSAARCYNIHTAGLLIRHGARVDALNREGQTPLMYGLQQCTNASIEGMARLAELLLSAGAHRTNAMKAQVTRIGTDFEFHRANFNPDHLDATSGALEKLYAIFDVPPVPRRIQYDGISPIVAKATRWEDQHDELWKLLVPSSGAASTVQGEVIRISGRIHIEMEGNGGINWDAGFKRMADAFLMHLASGTSIDDSLLIEAGELVAAVKRKAGDTGRLCQLAVIWVARNPTPMKLAPPNYDR
jgi:hypothetical protein